MVVEEIDNSTLINGVPAKKWESMTNKERDKIRARLQKNKKQNA